MTRLPALDVPRADYRVLNPFRALAAFWVLVAAVTLLALLVREWFVLTMVVPYPTQGDVSAYLRYALHLVLDGTFSMAEGGQPIIPDAFRSPGYPLLLAGLYLLPGDWHSAIYQAQAVMGAATVLCLTLLARQCLSAGWSLAAGVWMALQPHHIAATGAMLSEVLFGFTVAAGLLCAALAWRERSMPWAIAAGAVLGFGYLVNPVVAFLPLLLLPLFWRVGMAKHGAAVVLVALVFVGGWAGRNAAVDAQGDHRAAMNFVQGSHPEYHEAWKLQRMLMRAQHERISAEVATVIQQGIQPTLTRLASDPLRYAQWYASKPYLLWDWSIRIGQGGVYSLQVDDSPLERMPMAALVAVQIGLNKVVFALALLGIVLAIRRGGPAAMVAIAVVYVTAVHVVLQAEPRYSIPYRGLEILLAVSATAYLWERLRASSSGTAQQAG